MVLEARDGVRFWKLKSSALLAIFVVLVVGATVYKCARISFGCYHYADEREWVGIPNFGDVMSNIGFLLVGVDCLWSLYRERKKVVFIEPRIERVSYIHLSVGLIATAFGSGYYHWNPCTTSLVWDRLAMALIFSPLLCICISERVSRRAGLWLLFPMTAGSLYAVAWWYDGNCLNYYGVVQGFTILGVFAMLLLFPGLYSNSYAFWLSLVTYGVAMCFEKYDAQIYDLLDHVVSGHTFKHLTAALAVFWVTRSASRRRLRSGKPIDNVPYLIV